MYLNMFATKKDRQSSCRCRSVLNNWSDVERHETMLAARQMIGNTLAFLQAAVAVQVDGRKMYENLLTIACSDKTISFIVIKPFYCTNTKHKRAPSSINIILTAVVRDYSTQSNRIQAIFRKLKIKNQSKKNLTLKCSICRKYVAYCCKAVSSGQRGWQQQLYLRQRRAWRRSA